MQLLVQIAMVSVGSIVGGVLRWGVGIGFGRMLGPFFPWGTLFINVSGSLFLGWFSTVLRERLPEGLSWIGQDNLRLLVAVGFTGAYTTFSTFEYESYNLLEDGAGLKAWLYMGGSVFLGLAAVRCGVLLAKNT